MNVRQLLETLEAAIAVDPDAEDLEVLFERRGYGHWAHEAGIGLHLGPDYCVLSSDTEGFPAKPTKCFVIAARAGT